MTIEHSVITDPNVHEPKGASTAANGEVYISNGLGSGTWDKIPTSSINGLGSDGGVTDLAVVSDGAGGVKYLNFHAHGSMTVTDNSTAFSISAAADSTLGTPGQYVLMTGTGFPWTGESLHDMSFTTDRLTAEVNGIYLIQLWANISSFPSTNSKIAIRYLINGSTYSTRRPTVKSAGAGDEALINGFGLLQLNAGDYLQLVIASDSSGSVTFRDINNTLYLIRPV